jgi:hypothetical protein
MSELPTTVIPPKLVDRKAINRRVEKPAVCQAQAQNRSLDCEDHRSAGDLLRSG